MDFNEDHVGAFFALYGQLEEVAWILCKADVPSGDFSVQVIVDRTKFKKIPEIIMCRDKKIFVVMQARRTHCWLCPENQCLGQLYPRR